MQSPFELARALSTGSDTMIRLKNAIRRHRQSPHTLVYLAKHVLRAAHTNDRIEVLADLCQHGPLVRRYIFKRLRLVGLWDQGNAPQTVRRFIHCLCPDTNSILRNLLCSENDPAQPPR